jgi:hypothetical protein
MQRVFIFGIAYAEIVHHERENDIACEMLPQAWSNGTRDIAMGLEKLAKIVVGEASSLGKSVHATTDFNKNETKSLT